MWAFMTDTYMKRLHVSPSSKTYETTHCKINMNELFVLLLSFVDRFGSPLDVHCQIWVLKQNQLKTTIL